MDALDLQILSSLDADARRPFADLARELNVSQPTIADRVQRMEDRGILRGSMVCLDYARLGFSISAFVRIRTHTPGDRGLVQAAREMPQVVEMHSVTGEDCMVMKVVVRSVEELHATLIRLSAFGHSSTSIILDTPIRLRNPIPAQKANEGTKAGATSDTPKRAARTPRAASHK
jgi:Lrp/AsnC family leucine-responsive transcriptional regulator